jgi:hypothetical protein
MFNAAMQFNFFNKLNGWNRLFFLCSFIWIIFNSYIFYMYESPNFKVLADEDIAGILEYALYKQPDANSIDISRFGVPENSKVIVKSFGGVHKNAENVFILKDKDGACEKKKFVMHDNTEIEASCDLTRDEIALFYLKIKENNYKEVNSKYMESIATKAVLILFQIVSFYVFFYSVGWVIRGFKKKV